MTSASALTAEFRFLRPPFLAAKAGHVSASPYASPNIKTRHWSVRFLHGKFFLWIKEQSFGLQCQFFCDSINHKDLSDNVIQPAVESAVTKLLVAIKQLLEALTLWSTLKMSEGQVSDVYVRLGNDFNAAVTAFAAFNIDMTCVLHIYIT